MSKFLDSDGVIYLWSKITNRLFNKVDKVTGKGLSTNDFTDAYKTKLDSAVTSIPATTWDSIVGKPDVALKSDVASVYRAKGSVATYTALPTTDNTVGDVYNVEDTGMNYVWTGTGWDALGSVFTIEAITNSEIDVLCGDSAGSSTT